MWRRGEVAKPKRCGWQCFAFLNDALYSATHPSYTSNVGPTPRIFSRYVDVVLVVQWVVMIETDGRINVVVFKSPQDRISLIFIYAGNG